VLVQAALAGQFLNGQGQLVMVHRRIGETLPVVALVLVILALSVRRRVSPGALLVPSVVLMLLTVAQTGLGFVGRDTLGARSLHIPVGVALFGLGIYCLGAVKRLPPAAAG
jgi:heme A synthase